MIIDKPSPAQARLLRDLNIPKWFIRANSWGGKVRSCELISARYHRIKRPNLLTFRALLDRGWIKRTEKYKTHYVLSESGRSVLLALNDEDFITPKNGRMEANEIIALLSARYPPPKWVFFSELRFGTGYGKLAEQRLDAWAMHCWPSKKFLKIAFEVKVTHRDFLRELKRPKKRAAAMSVSNQFYFVAPNGIIRKREVPSGCGLMLVYEDKGLIVVKEAPFRDTDNPTWMFVASLGRRIMRKES
jgi:hypothetical protein